MHNIYLYNYVRGGTIVKLVLELQIAKTKVLRIYIYICKLLIIYISSNIKYESNQTI